MLNEDSDIKIFGADKSDSGDDDLLQLVETMQRYRSNGNTDKAHTLGKNLARSALAEPEKYLRRLPAGADEQLMIYSIRVLRLFAAEFVLYRRLPQALASTATDNFYACLSDEYPDFYERVSDGAAFTFYYLAARRPNAEKEIGKYFAMLCNLADSAETASLGTDIFVSAAEKVNSEIDGMKFIDF